ncbi:MAG: phage terminase small subunit [Humidesulfovibrio sp.]|nr:phage terminase small subunit [Humidesulfovibrio sp.]
MSLMRTHQKRLAAAGGPDAESLSAGARVLGTMPQGLMGGSKLAAMLAASLGEDLKALHEVASVERKAALKRDTLLPKYRDYVARLMGEGKGHELIGYYVVWAFDAGAIEEALQVAFWCLEHGQELPERFKSPLALFVSMQTLAWAEAEYNAGRGYEPYLGAVLAAMEAEGGEAAAWDVPDRIKAGFYRLVGLQAEKNGDLASAASNLERSMSLGGKVKTALDAVRKRQERDDKQLNSADGTEGASTSGAPAPEAETTGS